MSVTEKSDFRNRRLLLLRLLDYGNATKQNLVQWTGLSNTTVSDAINAMLGTGFVRADGMQKSIGGRRSVIYSINEEYGQFAGVEMWGRGARITICDARGRIQSHFQVLRRSDELSINLLYRAIDTLLERSEATNVLALGIGVEGQIDYSSQTVLRSNSLGWKNVPLKEIVERRIYLPVFIDSTINGQISLRKYMQGADCPAHFLILNDRFPYKAALCLDGHVCRGHANQCGAADGFSILVQQINNISGLLGLDQVWVACQRKSQMKEVERVLSRGDRISVGVYLSDPAELAWGMALDAETRWFGTIYSYAKNPIYHQQDSP